MSKAPKRPKSGDRELEAMGTILAVLEGLDGETTQRVLDYVQGRLSLKPVRGFTGYVAAVPSSVGVEGTPSRRASIRDLKDEKRPDSANQMAALVAYYLSELAPEGETKETIGTPELEKYFKQAGFRLPKSLRQALPNAAAAGYFDPAGSGRYRLNPVGYNLVVHALPPSQETKKVPRRPSSKKKKARR